MSRIIKFRSWDKKEQCFITDYDNKHSIIHFHSDGKCEVIQMILTCDCSSACGECCEYVKIHDRNVELMQFTGLSNAAGVEIYEGDKISFTISYSNRIDEKREGYVAYSGSGFMIWNNLDDEFYGNNGGFDLGWVVAAGDDGLKVIGHKYELSKGEK